MVRVMIPKWENEWISLSVLSMVRVLTAQWENEWISLSVLSMVWVMIPKWENEWISLSVLSMVRVLTAQWENECILLHVLSVTWVQFSALAKCFKGLSLTGHTRPTNHSSFSSAAEKGSISSQWHHTSCGHGGGRLNSNHGQTMGITKFWWF